MGVLMPLPVRPIVPHEDDDEYEDDEWDEEAARYVAYAFEDIRHALLGAARTGADNASDPARADA